MRPRPFARARTVGLVALLAVTIAGCGGLVKTGYRNGDTVGLFMMNRYLDLSGEQKEFVKPKLRSLLAWHRRTQLPDYTTLAIDLQRRAMLPITAAEVSALGEQLRQRATVTVDHAMPDMADIALRLTPDNIKALQDKFADDDDDFRDDNLTGAVEKRQKARYQKTLDRIEEWYGKFSPQQRIAIRQFSDARPLDNAILLAERQRREGDVIAMLNRVQREKPSRDEVVAMLKGVSERFEESPDPDRRAFLDALRQATAEMNAQIHDLATPQQRRNAVAKLQDWIDDFRTLSAEAAGS
jgi:hypothetical protein